MIQVRIEYKYADVNESVNLLTSILKMLHIHMERSKELTTACVENVRERYLHLRNIYLSYSIAEKLA